MGSDIYDMSGGSSVVNCTFICPTGKIEGSSTKSGNTIYLNNATFKDIANVFADAVNGRLILSGKFTNSGFGPISINKNDLTIIGTNNCILDAEGSSTIFNVVTSIRNIIFNNITFTNAHGTDGGAIVYDMKASGRVVNCTFINNTSTAESYGGGITVNNATCDVVNCTFINNTASKGSAVSWMYCSGSVVNCTFINNQPSSSRINGANSKSGNTIYLNSGVFSNIRDAVDDAGVGGTVILNGTYINSRNSLIRIDKNDLTIIGTNNCTLDAESFSRIFEVTGNNVIIKNITFTNGRVVGVNGGAIYWTGSNGRVGNCTFTGNTADYGGAIYWAGGNSTVSKCNFTGNTATYDGGAICWSRGNGTVTLCNFTNNNIVNYGSIYLNNNTYNNSTIINYNSILSPISIIIPNQTIFDQSQRIYAYILADNIPIINYLNIENNVMFNITRNSEQITLSSPNRADYIDGIYSYILDNPNLSPGTYQIGVAFNNPTLIHQYLPDITVKDGTYTIKELLPWNVSYNKTIIYGQTQTIKINNNNNIKAKLYINNKYESEDNTFTLTDLNAGNYNVRLEYTGDEYAHTNYTFTFTINRATTLINVTVQNITYPELENIHLEIPTDLPGDVVVFFDNRTYHINQTGTISLTDLIPGDYSIVVYYDGYDNYDVYKETFYFNVAKLSSTINVTNTVDSNRVTININVTKGATGPVIVTINNRPYYDYIDENGNARIITQLDKGEYNDVSVEYQGDNFYNNSATTTNFTITSMDYRGIGTLTDFLKDVNNTPAGNVLSLYRDYAYNETTDYWINNTLLFNKSINIEGNSHYIRLGHTKNITLSIAADNFYLNRVIVLGDGETTTDNLYFLTIVTGNNVTLSNSYFGNISNYVPGSQSAFVFQGNGLKVINTIFENITDTSEGSMFLINGSSTFKGCSFSNCNAMYAQELALIYGNTTLDSCTFNINSIGMSSIINVDGLGTERSKVDIINNEFISNRIGPAVWLKKVNASLSNNKLSEGLSFLLGSTSGALDYPIIASKIHVIISDNNTFIVNKSTVNLNVTLTDDNNNPIEIINLERVLVLKINDQNKTLQFSKNIIDGTTFYSVNYYFGDIGDYVISASLDELDPRYFGNDLSMDTALIKVRNTPDITLNYNNTAYYKQNITLCITAPVDATGIVNLTVPGNVISFNLSQGNVINYNISDLNAGSYYMILSYSGDEHYSSYSKIFAFDILKITPEIIFTIDADSVGYETRIAAFLPSDATGELYLIINGKLYTTVSGEVIGLDDLSAGEYTVFAGYNGDNNYNATSNETSFKIKKLPTYFNPKISTNGYNVNILIEFDSKLFPDIDGFVVVNVDNTDYYMKLKEGIGNINITCPTEGTYNVNINYNGNNKYEESSQSRSFTVSKKETSLISNITVDGNIVTIIIKVNDSDATGYVTITLDNVNYTATVINGVASIVLPADKVDCLL